LNRLRKDMCWFFCRVMSRHRMILLPETRIAMAANLMEWLVFYGQIPFSYFQLEYLQ